MAYKNVNTVDKQIEKSVSKAVGQALKKGVTTQYVESLKDRIADRTRLGIGIDPKTGNSMRLPKLSESYKETRQGKARYYTSKSGKKIRVGKNKNNSDYVKKPRLADTTTPARSNLTATGQLLKSLTVVKIKLKSGIAYIIKVGDKRGRGLFDAPSTIGNKKLVEYLAAQGRTFLGFTKSQKNQISREIRQMIRKFLR
tara:strand:+ start:513 stop:1106 length:594 start_codon:yes stop_codon:yes gene_type:complete